MHPGSHGGPDGLWRPIAFALRFHDLRKLFVKRGRAPGCEEPSLKRGTALGA